MAVNTVVVWEHPIAGTRDVLKLVKHEGTERTIGYVVRVAADERARSQFIKGQGWCEVLLRLTSSRKIARMKKIVMWVEESRPELLNRLNYDAWDFVGVLVEEREMRTEPLERMARRYGKTAGTN